MPSLGKDWIPAAACPRVLLSGAGMTMSLVRDDEVVGWG